MSGEPKTILVVDDDDVVRRLAERILEGAGYKVLSASSGSGALSLLEGFPGRVDLVLTDVVMAETGGRELAVRLAIKRQGLKVLFMSGSTNDEVLKRVAVGHGLHFIPKPFSPEYLLEKVKVAIHSSAATMEGSGA